MSKEWNCCVVASSINVFPSQKSSFSYNYIWKTGSVANSKWRWSSSAACWRGGSRSVHLKIFGVILLDAINTWIDRKLVKSLASSPYFSILADECCNISTTEELSICCLMDHKWRARGALCYSALYHCHWCYNHLRCHLLLPRVQEPGLSQTCTPRLWWCSNFCWRT